MPHLDNFPADANLLDVFRRWPEHFEPILDFHELLLRGDSMLTTAQRELIAAFVSGTNGCRYCVGLHTRAAENLGVRTGLVGELLADPDLAGADDTMRPVLRLARKLTVDVESVEKADIDAILAAGLNEDAVFHVVAIVALFNFMNRLVEGLGIELEPAHVEPAAASLADRGYGHLVGLLRR
ncbi:MAG: peroxidase-related enzyme [Gammaproteobacteria bacterium]|nr:peroxidase-related enzyme [Gammaproteobacteria bacterium]